MPRNLEVALVLKGRDDGAQRVAERTARAVIGLSRESQRMASAREQLGVRAERTIQREIRATEAAYQRLASSGTMSVKEQARAYDAMREKVAGLRREMATTSRFQRGMAAGAKGLAAGAAAAWAGGAVVASPMRRVANYDMRLSQMANTAFNETEINGRKLSTDEQLQRRRGGKAQLQEYIVAANREGGSSNDNAAALDKLIARGIFSPTEAGKLLPMISKAATAAGSSADEMTDVVMAAVQNAKIPVDQIPKALGMALKAGQMGGFELKDMAAWLPKMLAMGGMSGLRGTDGLASILAASQLAVTAAGGTDEAGNNVVNFLQKITSADTAADFKKISARSLGNKKKGEKGIDLYGTLAQARQEGMDPVEAFTRLVRKVAESDKEFSRLQRQAADAKNDKEKSAMYGSMADIMQARGVGKTIQDRQAMLALLPMLFDPKSYRDMKTGILGGGAQDVDINQRFIKEQAGFKFQQGENLKEQGEYDSVGKFNDAVGDVVGKLTEYGSQYPGLTAAVVGATTTISALAAAAGMAALPMLLGGKGGGLADLFKGGPATRGILAGPVAASGGLLARAGLAGILSILGLQVAKAAGLPDVDKAQGQKDLKAGNWWSAAAHLPAGDFISAAWKNLFGSDAAKPGARNAPVGAAPIPQLDMLQAAVNASTKLDLAAQKMQQVASQPIPVKVTVDVQNGNIVAAVNAANSQTARRY
ncbi:phage tail tape measure protein [Paludibacterium sp. B53371]|uniref:phage tail tape measure protein n=1 Tax=Paludibacterium sp. B53371 TaxID=2806263 RepID=UPI001C05047C|nr:phage tail tape measure protein [Paludibacterium sp. B53371]